MPVVVPFGTHDPKSRLAPILDAEERGRLAAAMLEDVLAAIRAAGREPTVLADGPLPDGVDAPVDRDARPLTPAVNAVLAGAEGPVAVVMADLPLATPSALRRLFAAPGDLVVAPGRACGTNALVVRDPDFRVDYHGASYLDHLRAARRIGATVFEVDSHRLSTDVDEPADLVEVLLHGEGRTRDWLRDAGVELAVTDGRVGVERPR